MKEIELSKQGPNRGKYVALVDDEEFEALNSFRWYVSISKNTLYAVRHITINGKEAKERMHNVILNGRGIDHIDHNGCNNMRSNLRFCTRRENNMNKQKRRNTSSTYIGVCFDKRTKKWMAQIGADKKHFHLGRFASEADAALAYNTKAIELFCEFANLNIINE